MKDYKIELVLGWVDNVNGVAGALLLGALGIARTMDGMIDFIFLFLVLIPNRLRTTVHCDVKADLIPGIVSRVE